MLKQQGYATAAIGKWHLGLTFDSKDFTKPITDGPLQHGFDYFLGLDCSLDVPPYDLIENNHWTEVPTLTKEFPSFMYGPVSARGPVRMGPAAPDFQAVKILPELTNKAVSYITDRAKDKKPFFLYLALPSPHNPEVPAKQWQGKSGLGPYCDYVMETDWSLGQVLKAIDKTGIGDNTIVMLASDNGCAPYIDVHGIEKEGHYPSGWFRGYKADIWDGGHRIPYIVRWPGVVKPNSTCGQIIELTDLIATVADIENVLLPADAGPDSFSVLPLFRGNDKPVHHYNVYHSLYGNFAIQEGRWKLELCPGSGGWTQPKNAVALAKGLPPVQLYDMFADIGETKNLEADHPKIVARLTADLKTCVANGRSRPGPVEKDDVKVDIWKLSALPAQKTKLLKVGD